MQKERKRVERYFLNTREVATVFGVTVKTVQKWATSQRLPGIKIGKKWFFNKTDIWEIKGE